MGSFVGELLHQQLSHLLFRVAFVNGQEGVVYILFENLNPCWSISADIRTAIFAEMRCSMRFSWC